MKYGCIPSPKDLRDYRVCMASQIDLPLSYEVKHSKIKNQGNVNSCVAHSITEILELKDGIDYSTGWIYGYRPTGYYSGKGMVPSEALKTITKVGYIKSSSLNENYEMNAAKSIVDATLDKYIEEANERKIGSYARLYSIKEIKEAIYTTGKPILLSIGIGEDGLVLDKDYIAQIPEARPYGHMMVCYGWNEIGLLIQNSWGEEWGNKGTFILPYEYPIAEAWAISYEKQQELVIRKPNNYLLRELLMKIIKLLRKGK